MKQYRVTIGIPVYNVEKYIRLALESALAQTFEDIEFLILDDCGVDGSIDIIREYQQQHQRGCDIRIVSQPANGGIGRARNRIIDEAQGKYLYFMDADDTITPDTIELLYENALKHNAQIVYGSYELVKEFEEQVEHIPYQYPFLVFQKEDEFADYVFRKYNGIQSTTWNFLIDIELLKKNTLYYQSVNYWEDLSFTLDLPTYITRAVLLPDITYSYHCRYGSLSNFDKRDSIDKEEILRTIKAVNQNKENTDRLRQETYFPKRMYKLMMTDFYMVCSILSKKKIIKPAFSDREICAILASPLTLYEILHFRQARLSNLMLYILSVLPPFFSVFLMERIGKAKGLVT